MNISARPAMQSIVSSLVFSLMVSTAAWSEPSLKQAIESYKLGKYKSALAQFSELRLANPADPVPHYYSGLCYQFLGQMAAAGEEYRWVIEHSKDQDLISKAKLGLKQLEPFNTSTRQNQRQASANPVNKLPAELQSIPPGTITRSDCYSSYGGLDGIADCLCNTGKYQEVDTLFTDALKQMHNDTKLGPSLAAEAEASVMVHYAYFLRKMRRDAEAIEMEARAKALNPNARPYDPSRVNSSRNATGARGTLLKRR